MNPIHRNYSESSAQTIEQDPDKLIKNFQLNGKSLISSIQTDAPTETPSRSSLQTTLKDVEDADDDDGEEEEEELEFQLQKRLNPRKQEDFVALQSELLQWRRREERKILITCGNQERKRELTTLLIKETCLLRKIESLKNEAHSKVKANKVEQSILKMVQPRVWQTCQGDVQVETLETSLAIEMKGIHDDVRRKINKIPERIDLLQRVKLFLHRIHSNTTLVKDILVLVNRELEILQRDTAELGNDMLEGMRTRLQNLFTKLMFKTNAMDDGSKGTRPKLLIVNKSLQPIIT